MRSLREGAVPAQIAGSRRTTGRVAMNPRPAGRSYLRIAAVLCLILLWLVSLAGPAVAHEELVGSSPAEGAKLERAPTQVELRFAGPVIPEGVAVTVTTSDGRRWEAGPARAAGTTVTTAVQTSVPAGRYTIGYRVVSSDGHPVTGAVDYEVTTTATDESTPQPAAADPPAQSDPSEASRSERWPWIIATIVMLALGIVVVRRTK